MILPLKILGVLKGEQKLPFYFYPLYLPECIYSIIVRVRAGLYRSGIMQTRRLPCRVISVGNLAAGGTGKTPFTIYLCSLLKDKGFKPAVVTRGYKGASEGSTRAVSDGRNILMSPSDAGDEAVLLAKNLPGVPVVMGSNRYEAGMLSIERFGTNVVVLDDGYQHLALKRDLNILLMDATHPFGNGHTLPLGYLREPKDAAGRADMIALTRSAGVELKPSGLPAGVPVIRAAYSPSSIRNIWNNSTTDPVELSGRNVMPVAAVADPASFSLLLNSLNAKILKGKFYPDHHSYSRNDLSEIEAAAIECGADFVVVTEKDAVKLSAFGPAKIPFLALGIKVELIEGSAMLEGFLNKMSMEKT
jgi:tetraacyldisaccharide 4'-kinase